MTKEIKEQKETLEKLNNIAELIALCGIRIESFEKSINGKGAEFFPNLKVKWQHKKNISEATREHLVAKFQKLSLTIK